MSFSIRVEVSTDFEIKLRSSVLDSFLRYGFVWRKESFRYSPICLTSPNLFINNMVVSMTSNSVARFFDFLYDFRKWFHNFCRDEKEGLNPFLSKSLENSWDAFRNSCVFIYSPSKITFYVASPHKLLIHFLSFLVRNANPTQQIK